MSVCLSARLLKKLRTDFSEIFGGTGRGRSNNQFDFDGDSDHNTVPVFFVKDCLFTIAVTFIHFISFY